jgi:hypothetical protein
MHRGKGRRRAALCTWIGFRPSAFGLFAVTAMVVCYALETRSPWFIMGFAVSCLLGSIYGLLQGAWPFGLVEAVWAVIAVVCWRTRITTQSTS